MLDFPEHAEVSTTMTEFFQPYFHENSLETITNNMKTLPVPVAPSDGALWEAAQKLCHCNRN
jgi:hypothetical protein